MQLPWFMHLDNSRAYRPIWEELVITLERTLDDSAYVIRQHNEACERLHPSLGDYVRDLSADVYDRDTADELRWQHAAQHASSALQRDV